jgi:tetratricopeptide (TPR) repeat protein
MSACLKYFLTCIICLTATISLSQDPLIDSLTLALKNAKDDTIKLSILFAITECIEDENVWPIYNNQALKLAEKLSISNSKQIAYRGKKGIAEAYNNLGFLFGNSDERDKALNYYQKSIKIQEDINDLEGLAQSLNNLGGFFAETGDHKNALKNFEKSLSTIEKNGDKKGTAQVLNSIAGIYYNQGDIPTTILYFTKSLKIYEEIGDKPGVAKLFNNLGSLYMDKGDNKMALEYYNKSLKIQEEIGDKKGMAISLNNLASLYKSQGELKASLNYFIKSLFIHNQLGNKKAIANNLNNIGHTHFTLGNIDLALEYYKRGLIISEEITDKEGITRTLANIGNFYFKTDPTKALNYYTKSLNTGRSINQKDLMSILYNSIGNIFYSQKKYNLATLYLDSSLVLSKELCFANTIRDAEKSRSTIDSAKGDFAGAFDHYKNFILLRDSLNNEGTRKASIKSQLNYEFEKKEAVMKEQQEKERIVAKEKDRFQQIIIWSVVFGLLLVGGFAAFVFRSLKITKHQKHIIEEKQKEILDSIYYAKRIQTSLLPTEKYIERIINPSKK